MKRAMMLVATLAAGAAFAADLVPLKIDYPKPMFVGTPVPLNVPNLEKPQTNAPAALMVPAGTELLSKGKPVTASDNEPLLGDLTLLTDYSGHA